MRHMGSSINDVIYLLKSKHYQLFECMIIIEKSLFNGKNIVSLFFFLKIIEF